MKNGLAIWHYPHRSTLDNVEYFINQGFSSVSLHGNQMFEVACDQTQSARLADLIRERHTLLSIHGALPYTHKECDVQSYMDKIDAFAKWQAKYGLIEVLSFDVHEPIRDHITEYIKYALEHIPMTKIALEDFGLNDDELRQIQPLRANKHLGYLLDIGHMNLRILGKNQEGLTLFKNSPSECPQSSSPTYDDFIRAFKSKALPIFEIHLHQNNGISDQHYFLKDGCIDVPMIAELLHSIQFDGILTLECAPGYRFECKNEAADQGIMDSYSYWLQCNMH